MNSTIVDIIANICACEKCTGGDALYVSNWRLCFSRVEKRKHGIVRAKIISDCCYFGTRPVTNLLSSHFIHYSSAHQFVTELLPKQHQSHANAAHTLPCDFSILRVTAAPQRCAFKATIWCLFRIPRIHTKNVQFCYDNYLRFVLLSQRISIW